VNGEIDMTLIQHLAQSNQSSHRGLEKAAILIGLAVIAMMPSALSAQADIQQVSRWNVSSAEGLGSGPLKIRQMIYRSDGLHVVVQRGRDFLILSRDSSGRDKVTPIGAETPAWVDADGKGTFLIATADPTSRALVHEIDTEGRVLRNWPAPDNFPLSAVFFSDGSPMLFSQHGQWLRAEGPLSDAVRMSFESNPGGLLVDGHRNNFVVIEAASATLHRLSSGQVRETILRSPNIEHALGIYGPENDRYRGAGVRTRSRIVSAAYVGEDGTIVTIATGRPVSEGFPFDVFQRDGVLVGSGIFKLNALQDGRQAFPVAVQGGNNRLWVADQGGNISEFVFSGNRSKTK
jgi:hypothetical protein